MTADIQTLPAALSTVGRHAGERRGLLLEWSIGVGRTGTNSDRFTCWRGVDESRFAGIQSTLRAVEAPMEVCRAQVEATADGVRQGIGV
ncbi:MAG TPA: hypothetical protein PLA94_31760, partial [Myxococcota bacterium]|nr:hypothetical protein [Myxococcota bacterium]